MQKNKESKSSSCCEQQLTKQLTFTKSVNLVLQTVLLTCETPYLY